jgi:molybdenum cofactor cytidylyltransferase
MQSKKISLVVLAAGESSRMGTPKQLLKLHGKSLLELVLDQTTPLKDCVKVVVLGSRAEQIKPIVGLYGDHVSVTNTQWKNGMGSSIKAGLSFILQNFQKMDAVIFLTCDQPGITTQHLENLIGKYQDHGPFIVSTGYNSTEGVPALFDHALFQEVMKIDDAEGARKIIASCSQSDKLMVDFPDASVDLDTKADVEHYLQDGFIED